MTFKLQDEIFFLIKEEKKQTTKPINDTQNEEKEFVSETTTKNNLNMLFYLFFNGLHLH